MEWFFLLLPEVLGGLGVTSEQRENTLNLSVSEW